MAGAAHLLFVCTLFVLFRYVSGSHRVAGVALLLYASESLFSSFDSMFVYQTLALPFFGLTVLASGRLAAPQAAGHRAGWFTVAVLSACATVVTHHVTSYLLVATLELITLGALLTRDRRLAAWASILALVSAAAFGAWIVFVAPSTVGYLEPAIQARCRPSGPSWRAGITGAAAGIGGDRAAGEPGAGGGGRPDHVGTGTRGLVAGWRRYRRQPWVVAFAIGAVSWYVIVAVRLVRRQRQ